MSEETTTQVEQPVEGSETGQKPGVRNRPEITAPSEAPAEEAEVPAWRKALDEAPADELRKHDRISGIVGSEKQAWEKQWEETQRSQMRAEETRKAQAELEAAEAELDKLYNDNPMTFADTVQNKRLIERQQRLVGNLQVQARTDIARKIGAAYHDLPEWQQVINDPNEYATLMSAIQGKSDDEVMPAWNRAAADAVARIRAKSLAETQVSERLTKERAAWEEEAAARGLATSTRPDIARGGRAATLDPEPSTRNLPAWNAWYARNTKGAKRA